MERIDNLLRFSSAPIILYYHITISFIVHQITLFLRMSLTSRNVIDIFLIVWYENQA